MGAGMEMVVGKHAGLSHGNGRMSEMPDHFPSAK